ncbi:hypothetical protein FT641_18715 [Bacillus paranthracis]|uniref:hypothetical protein n=1 Tax=Bacillus paranthracis TaxID=2026186 RepID=UPI00187936E8|nr:hypothetical protein [Bacillus paranthracis]MBE7114402.1 hypothetical protein [Bacillus paranthracis]MBE7154724.1 hypothetical protein [Bacillus paranthracis]
MYYYVHKDHINELEVCKEELGLQPALDKMVVEDKAFQLISDFTNFDDTFDFIPLDSDEEIADEIDVRNLVKCMECVDTYVLYTVKDEKPPLNREDSTEGYDLVELVRIGNIKYFESLEETVRDALDSRRAVRIVDKDASIVSKSFGEQFSMFVFINCEFDERTMGVVAKNKMVMSVNNTFPVTKLKECIGKDNAVVCIREDKVMPGFLEELEDAGVPCVVVVPYFWGTGEDCL